MEIKKQWLEVLLDEKKSIVILKPHWALSENDFLEASKKIDSYLEKNQKLNWVIIYAKSFPYWDSFLWLISHLKFIKNHHKRVAYLAFVTDSLVWIFAEHIWDFFVKAKVKNFDYDQLEEAKKWIFLDEDWIINHKFYVNLDTLKTWWYVEIKIMWKLTHEDYSQAVLILDWVLEKVEAKDFNILIDISDFDWWELKAAWDDFKFWMKHGFVFGKIAIFWNEKKWLEYWVKITSWFIKWKMKQFGTKKEALEWLK